MSPPPFGLSSNNGERQLLMKEGETVNDEIAKSSKRQKQNCENNQDKDAEYITDETRITDNINSIHTALLDFDIPQRSIDLLVSVIKVEPDKIFTVFEKLH